MSRVAAAAAACKKNYSTVNVTIIISNINNTQNSGNNTTQYNDKK